MEVTKISHADIYRDGGSYGFTFDSDDGNWYVFFVQYDLETRSYQPPAIYLEGPNNDKIVREFTWEEARDFVAPLRFENHRFARLVELVLKHAQ